MLALLLGLALCGGTTLAGGLSSANAQAPLPPLVASAAGNNDGPQPAVPVATSTPSPTCVVGGQPGQFRLVQHMPAPALDVGFAGDGHFAYSAGGWDNAAETNIDQLARYDPAQDHWVTLAPIPTPVSLAPLVYSPADNKLYSFGDLDNDCNAQPLTQIYDIASNTWVAGPALPAPRAGFAGAGYWNGQIILAGGGLSCDFTTAQSQTWIYNIGAGTWMTGTAMPQARIASASGVVNGHLYVLGGSDETNTVVNTIYDYNIATDTWATATTSLLNPVYLTGATVTRGRIWIVGGEDFVNPSGPAGAARARQVAGPVPHAPLGLSQIFDPATGSVTWGPFLNLARSSLGLAAVGNAILAAGGFNGGNAGGDFSLDVTEVSIIPTVCAESVTPTTTPPPVTGTPTCVSGITQQPWAVASPMPTVSFLAGVAGDGTFVYAAGGSDGTIHDQLARYNPATDSWTTLAPMPVAANGLALVYASATNKLYAFGGTDVITHALDLTHIYDIATDTWSSGAPMPNPRSRFAGAAYSNGKIYLVGGTNPSDPGNSQNDTWEYDVLQNTWLIKLPIPIPLSYAASAIVDGHLYVIGGRTRLPPTLNTVYDYDIAHDFWTLLDAHLPSNVWVPGGTTVHGRVWVVGGQRGSVTYATQIFDPRTRTFSEGPSLNVARYGLGAATAGNYVVAIGGYAFGPDSLDTTEVTMQLPDCSPPPTPTPCAIAFADVPSTNAFYSYIRCLACRGIVGGYPCGGPGEPCPGTYYRPNSTVTRGQVAQIVAESAGFADPVPSTQQTFQDVAPGSTFHLWVERLSTRGIIGGYPCGGALEPCIAPANRPYFRPNDPVTRGQIAKIIAGAAGWTETPTGQTFEDAPPGSTFYLYIERLVSRGIIGGYPCGGAREPCIAPGNRPYFRPNANATRGQLAKVATQSFYPGCVTPGGR
jgi:N-acetylneuraminic acid mutarotase